MGPTLPSKTNKMKLSDKDYNKMSQISSQFCDDSKKPLGFVNTEIVGLTSTADRGSCTYSIVIKLSTCHLSVPSFHEFV
jgi:hypothetical protein